MSEGHGQSQSTDLDLRDSNDAIQIGRGDINLETSRTEGDASYTREPGGESSFPLSEQTSEISEPINGL